ncbi:MAG: S8 family serine peptidase [Candidatus Zixiibacteriota bacterium]
MDYILFPKRKTRPLAFLVITAIFTISLITPLQADTPTTGQEATQPKKTTEEQSDALLYMPGQLVVKFISDTVKSDVFGEIIEGAVVDHLNNSGVYLYEVNRDANSYSLAEEVELMSQVAYAHPNYVVNPLHPVQGSYPFSDDAKTGDIQVQASVGTLELSSAQQYTTGANVTVAVIDGGVEDTHSFLTGKVSTGYDYIDDDNYAFDEAGGFNTGHGTFVAGIIHLVAPDAQIKAYRITSPLGEGNGFTLAKAIEQAVMDGCNIINLSVVLTNEHFAVRDAIDFARTQGVSVITAAGNAFSEAPVYPAANNNNLAVAAIDTFNILAGFSSYGSHVDVCAPGTNIYSAYKDDGYAWWNGTSFATPFVSGQMALLKQLHPQASVSQLENAIQSSATNIDNLNLPYTGKIGSGLISPLTSLNLMTSTDSLWVEPDTLYFTYVQGLQYLVVHESSFMLASTNAPAEYYGRITTLDGDPVFLTAEDSLHGYTNDSITVYLSDYSLTAGTYYNNIRFFARDVIDPADVIVVLTVTENENPTAEITPDHLSFWAPVGAEYEMIGYAYLTSTNAPAAYSASVKPGGDQICYPQKALGITDDSANVIVDCSRVSAPGFYYDTIVYQVQGTAQPTYLTVELEIRDTVPPVDSAWIVGDDWLYFETTLGSNDTMTGCFQVLSSNAPANYFVELAQPARIPIVYDSVGVTGDSFCFTISTTGLPVDIYNDTLLIYVDGVDNYPIMAIIVLHVNPDPGPTEDSAWVYPQMLEFTHIFNAETFAPMTEYVSIFSSNAPAPYVMTVAVDTETVFVTPNDTIYGTTDDSILITVNPYEFSGYDTLYYPPPGVYYNYLEFRVDGVANPVYTTVKLNVVEDTLPDEYVTVTPDHLHFTANEGTYTVLTGQVFLNSQPQGVYSSTVHGYGFTEPEPDSAVGTPDTATIYVIPSAVSEGPGVYYDTVLYYVQGIEEPALLQVTLEITSDYDTAWVYPYAQGVESPFGVDTIYPGMLFIGSSNAPAQFVISPVDPPDFVWLTDTVGMTNDSVFFDIIASSSMAPGVYVDTLRIDINGAINSPRMAVVFLHIDTLTGTDTAWVYPYAQYFLANEGESKTEIGAVYIGSDNQPALFTVEVQDYADFIHLTDSVGLTGDSFYFDVVTTPYMSARVYIDTLKFFIEGVHNNPYRSIVYLFIDSTFIPEDSFWVFPDSAIFGSELGKELVQYSAIYIGASDSSRSYFIEFIDNPDITVLLDSMGTVNDSAFYEVHATAAMPVGSYSDLLLIHFDDQNNTSRLVTVKLIISENNEPDTIYVEPEELYVTIPYGATDPVAATVFLRSSNAPAQYYTNCIGDIFGGVSFVDSVGYTNDSITVLFDPTLLDPEMDTLLLEFEVDGIEARKYMVVTMIFEDETPPDSIYVSPEELLLDIPIGSSDTVAVTLFLGSTNAPAMYHTNVIGDIMGCVSFADSVGYTNDSITVLFDPTLMDPAMDTLLLEFTVDGIEARKYVLVSVNFMDITQGNSVSEVAYLQNYPNPFNPETNIEFSLAEASKIKLEIFNILGQLVVTVAEDDVSAGTHIYTWRGKDSYGQGVSSGIYIYRLTTEKSSMTRKMLLLK